MGLSLDALLAGNIPNIIPILTAETKAKITELKDIIAVKNLFIINTTIKLKIIHIIHHIKLNNIDSARN
jgi:hypothetical protein